MLRRVDRDEPRERAAQALLDARETNAVVAPVLDVDLDGSLLPRDHPQWVKDALTVSQRARALIAGLRPVVVRILTFWDHRVRTTLVGASRVSIDPSGSYRLD